jgi:hypothetical protein
MTLEIVPLIALGATALILIVGIIFMMLGNKLNVQYRTKLMSARVVVQALTVIGFAILYYIQKYFI